RSASAVFGSLTLSGGTCHLGFARQRRTRGACALLYVLGSKVEHSLRECGLRFAHSFRRHMSSGLCAPTPHSRSVCFTLRVGLQSRALAPRVRSSVRSLFQEAHVIWALRANAALAERVLYFTCWAP